MVDGGVDVKRVRVAMEERVRKEIRAIERGHYPPIPDLGIVESAEVVGNVMRVVKPFSLEDVAMDVWWEP